MGDTIFGHKSPFSPGGSNCVPALFTELVVILLFCGFAYFCANHDVKPSPSSKLDVYFCPLIYKNRAVNTVTGSRSRRASQTNKQEEVFIPTNLNLHVTFSLFRFMANGLKNMKSLSLASTLMINERNYFLLPVTLMLGNSLEKLISCG